MSKKNKVNKVVTPPATEEVKVENANNVQVENPVEQKEVEDAPAPRLDMPLMPSTEVQANGLDPNHQVDLIRLTHEYFRASPDLVTKYNISPDVVDNMNHINMIGIAAAWANEMTFSKTPFATKLRTTMLPEMAAALKELGIKADKILALPAETDGTTTVAAKDVQIPKVVKDQMKAEHKIQQETVELDPTKIQNKTEVFKTVQHLLTNKGSVYPNIMAAINFYKSWLLIQAGDDEAEKTRINARTVKDILLDIADFTGACPFVLKGIGGYLLRLTMTHNSIVPAFCILRDTVRNKRTGETADSEKNIADICYALVNWAANARISEKKKNLEVLNTDKKKNKDAITEVGNDIRALEDTIASLEQPDSTFADTVLENLKSAEETVSKAAHEAFCIIAKCYYPTVNLRKRYTNLAENVKQLCGIITNLFRDPMSPLSNFNVANLDKELKEAPADEPVKESPKTEEKADESSQKTEETPTVKDEPEKTDESSEEQTEQEPAKEEKKTTPKMARKMKKALKKMSLSRKKQLHA